MRRALSILTAAALIITLAPIPSYSVEAVTDDLTGLVNPFVGTQNFGNTFPGASAPFGMAQVSPDTGGQGGYDYTKTSMYGFSQTHLSGVGCEVMGELPVMPTTGPVEQVQHDQYASPFSHQKESAKPGHYQVHLDRYGVDAELTATERTGWQRYTFADAGKPANVLFNTGTVTSAGLPDRKVNGTVVVRNARCASATDTSCAVDLSEYYDHDGTATAAATTEGNFDGSGWAFDGDLMPAAGPVLLAGTTYHAPSAAGTANNFVEARGQSVLFPAGEYGAVHVVGSAHHGSVSSDVRFTYEDGSESTARLTMTDWASGEPEPGNSFALQMAHRIQNDVGPVGPPVSFFEARLPLTAGKKIQSVSLMNDDRLEIYAITLVKPAAAALAPAQTDPLYDHPTPNPSHSPPVS